MRPIILFFTLFALSGPAFGGGDPCEARARKLFEEVTGQAPSQFGLSSSKFNAWADTTEYVYVAANSMSSAYVIEYFYLDGKSCLLNAMRFDGDM